MRERALETRARRKETQLRHLMRIMLAGLVASIVAIGGCAGMSETEQRTLTGGAGGAAAGAAIGALAGNAGLGAAIGGGAGLAGGFLLGRHNEARNAAYQQGVADGMRQAQQQPMSR
jgi:osmotically inducible lipoprotein OsmB